MSFVNSSFYWRYGELLTAAGVIAGVFGSGGLEGRVPAIRQKAFMTAVNYTIFNGLALMAISFHDRFSTYRYAAIAILAGTTLFAASTATIVLTGDRFKSPLVVVAPIGALIFISGYITFAF